MKKIAFTFLALTTMALMAGCSDDETATNRKPNKQPRSIDIEAAAESLTKADEMTAADLRKYGFQIIAVEEGTPSRADTTYAFTDRCKYMDGKWVFENSDHNWPESNDDELSFYAFFSADKDATLGEDYYSGGIVATLNDNLDGQSDYMIASAQNLSYASNGNTLNLNFTHSLVETRFSLSVRDYLQNEYPDYRVEIEMKSYSVDQYSWDYGRWTASYSSDQISYMIEKPLTFDESEDGEDRTFIEMGSLMLPNDYYSLYVSYLGYVEELQEYEVVAVDSVLVELVQNSNSPEMSIQPGEVRKFKISSDLEGYGNRAVVNIDFDFNNTESTATEVDSPAARTELCGIKKEEE